MAFKGLMSVWALLKQIVVVWFFSGLGAFEDLFWGEHYDEEVGLFTKYDNFPP